MTTSLRWTGFLATLVIVVVLPIYAFTESNQQEQMLDEYRLTAVMSATDMYAENCTVCHGSSGEGIGANPPLNDDAVQMMSENDLFKVISRGRDNTLMAAWAVDEGGVFSTSQVNDLVTLIQAVNWEYVEARVTELGLIPPQVVEMEVSDEMLDALVVLPDGEALSSGLLIYAENCAACHGSNAAGSVIAPALDSVKLRTTPREDLEQIVSSGSPGTLMAGWQNMLSPEQISSVLDLIYRWPEIVQTGIDFPESHVLQISPSPEVIADDLRLGGAHPVHDTLRDLGQQHQPSHGDCQDQCGPDVLPG